MSTKGMATTYARKNIQNAIEQAEEDRRRKLLNQRLEIARSGVASYRKHRVGDAVKAFHTYIRILEDLKNCGEGGLMPTMFDLKRDLSEMLLISGIYWDLTKLYDRTKSPNAQREFHHYLEKYIIFSRNMPYQTLCAETMRKYLRMEKAVHKIEFKNAYKLISGSNCFVATSLVDLVDEDAVARLRLYRNETLSRSRAGRSLISAYELLGPIAAVALDRSPERVRRAVARGIEAVALRLT